MTMSVIFIINNRSIIWYRIELALRIVITTRPARPTSIYTSANSWIYNSYHVCRHVAVHIITAVVGDVWFFL